MYSDKMTIDRMNIKLFLLHIVSHECIGLKLILAYFLKMC